MLDKFKKINIDRLFKKSNVNIALLSIRILVVLCILGTISWTIFFVINRSLVIETDINNVKTQIDLKLNSLEKGVDENDVVINPKKIDRSKIFGDLVTDTSKNSAEEIKPTENIPLSLVGVFLDEQSPYAIVQEDKKKEQDIFTLKEIMFNTALLVTINPDSIEIERNGKREVLFIDEGGSSDAKSANPGFAGSNEGGTVFVDGDKLDEALENLPLLLTQARAVPYFKDGQSVGLRLFAIKTGSLFSEIGLKNGDILKDINGSSLADITQAIKLFEQLKQERSINLKLERGKQEVVYNYEIK